MLGRLSQLLRLDRDEIVERLISRRYSTFRPIPIAIDVAPEIVYAVREQQELFPGVVAETLPVRTYPQGQLAAHLVGYLGEISEDRARGGALRRRVPARGVGRSRRARAGLRDGSARRGRRPTARGQPLEPGGRRAPGSRPGPRRRPRHLARPRPAGGRRAAARRGDHRAAASNIHTGSGTEPALDGWVGGGARSARRVGAGHGVVPELRPAASSSAASARRYWTEVTSEENEFPLLNRVIQSAHPPGSVFKTVTGAAFMEAGRIGPQGTDQLRPRLRGGRHHLPQLEPRRQRGPDGPVDGADALVRHLLLRARLRPVARRAEPGRERRGDPADRGRAVRVRSHARHRPAVRASPASSPSRRGARSTG